MKKLIVFASGSKDGGGSGFENLINKIKTGILNAEIVSVVSNHESGGVRNRADKLGIPFIHFNGPYTAENYQKIVSESGAEYVSLSGWLKLVAGLDPKTTFNIHPGLLPDYGGHGMYGHHVHEKVIADFKDGICKESGLSMHFVTKEYDKGPTLFEWTTLVTQEDTAETLASRVNAAEHYFQPIITNMILEGEIYWDGKNSDTLFVPFKKIQEIKNSYKN